MTRLKESEPPGWRDLRAKLQNAKDPAEFQAIVNEINRLLAAHEKLSPETLGRTSPKASAKKSKGAKAR